MNGLAVLFVCINVVAMFWLPRRWACVPLLAGACYITYGQGIDVGGITFTVVRMLILAGFIRVVIRGERLTGGVKALDWLMIAWGAAAVVSSVGHEDPSGAFIYRAGLFYDCGGIYFLLRIWCRDVDDVVHLCRITAFLIAPVALEMLSEKATGRNMFAMFGGVSPESAVREGRIRAQGPFMHPILAGTVGAVCLPLMVSLWHHHRKSSILGAVGAMTMVMASGSSGPLMSAIFATGALCMWRLRQYLHLFRWSAVAAYVVLDLVMKVPPYYLLARLDLAGGSTGWHRAELINAGIRHLGEWWLFGTDYTRHWMPTGVSWNPNHTDITNHYLSMGVLGGLPLMLLLIAVLITGFVYVGRTLRAMGSLDIKWRFFVWALGASLFANAATFVSVSFFDQSFVFFYLALGAIGSMWSSWSGRRIHRPATRPAAQVHATRPPAMAGAGPHRRRAQGVG